MKYWFPPLKQHVFSLRKCKQNNANVVHGMNTFFWRANSKSADLTAQSN